MFLLGVYNEGDGLWVRDDVGQRVAGEELGGEVRSEGQRWWQMPQDNQP